jgi:hypothetical protein
VERRAEAKENANRWRVGDVSRTGSAAEADWARGMGGGTVPSACRQRGCSSTPHAESITEFAADSPLEEAVSSEPVSVWNFPASSEFAGNFARFGISAEFQGPKTYVSPTTYGANSLDIGAGNFYDVAGN